MSSVSPDDRAEAAFEAALNNMDGRQHGLVAALARAQLAFPAIVKSHTNPAFRGSQYADVADVLAAVRPVLAAEGIVVTQSTRIREDGGVTLVTSLMWGDGQEILSAFPLPVEGLTAQQVGSLLTYHRRYQLCALLGVHPVGDDDDGNLAATAAPTISRGSGESVPYKAAAATTASESIAMAAASPPEKPLAAMTAGEMARYGESIGVRVSGSKADILRQLEPIVLAASGEEPFEVTTNAPVSEGAARSTDALDGDAPNGIPFNPVVASAADDSGTARRQRNAIAKETAE